MLFILCSKFYFNRNAQATNDNKSQEKTIVSDNSISPSENQQQFSRSSPKLRVISTNFNSSSRDSKFSDELQRETPLKKPKRGIGLKKHNGIKFTDKSNISCNDIFNKELVVVIDNSINEVIKDMVNSTSQHPKSRKHANSTVNSSNNATASTRDPISKKSSNGSIMIKTTKTQLTTATPVIEVIIYAFTHIYVNN